MSSVKGQWLNVNDLGIIVSLYNFNQEWLLVTLFCVMVIHSLIDRCYITARWLYVVRHHERHKMSEKRYFSFWQIWILQILSFNPILTGGGGQFDPPCTKSTTASRPPQIATRLFMTFFFQVLRIFWYQVSENRTVGREVTRRFVLARRHKICPKSAFCIDLCTKHMEITDFLKMH